MRKYPAGTRLVLVDDEPKSWLRAACEGSAAGSRWEIFPLGYSSELYRAQHSQDLARLKAWSIVDVSAIVGEARRQVREGVPDLIGELQIRHLEDARSIRNLFQGRGFNAWWFLEIVEKSAYRGPFVNRLYYLALIETVIRRGGYSEVWVCLKDQVLAEALVEGFKEQNVRFYRNGAKAVGPIRMMCSAIARSLKSAVGITVLHYLQVVMIWGLGIARRAKTGASDVLVFSFYPLMWTDPYSDRATEWYFGSLPALSPKACTIRPAVWLTISSGEIWRRRRELRSFVQRNRAICLTLNAGVTVGRLLLSPKWWRAQIKLSVRWKRCLNLRFCNFPVDPIVVDELRRSLSSTELFRDLLIFRAWCNLSGDTAFKAVLYRLEFQPFESAIVYGTGGRARTIAFQHFLFGRNFLPCFLAPHELKADSGSGGRPMPDIILTAGAFGREVMLRNGCRPETVEVCGPLRHHKLMMRQGQGCEQGDAPRSRLGIEADARVLVVATAVSKEEAEGLLAALRANVSDLKPFVVMFKSHPALSLDQKFLEVVGRLMEDSAYRILQSVDDLYDALAVAEAAVVNHSTVTIEAMVLGALPIVFDSGAVYDPKAMESDEYGGLMVSNVDELRKALHEAARQRGCREMLRERLVAQSTRWFDRSTLQPHQRLVEILERHGILSAQGVEAR